MWIYLIMDDHFTVLSELIIKFYPDKYFYQS